MPTVTCDKERLFQMLDRPEMTIEEFDEICFDFGVELDDVTSEREQVAKMEHFNSDLSKLSERTLLKIDVSANRYDLLCEEGLGGAMRVYLGLEKPPVYRAVKPAQPIRITVKKSVEGVRPFIVGAVLRQVTLDKFSYDSLIELQEKLHQGLCRRRTKVAIGTHDLDTLVGPQFTYEAHAPEAISFIPLNQKTKMNGRELMQFYESDRRLSKFLPIIRDSPVYPVVLDQNRTVCSLPPIINGDHSKIKMTTKNIFIECTATEEHKARMVLNYLCASFAQYCKDKNCVEQIEVVYEADPKTVHLYPDLSVRYMNAPISYINACIGKEVQLKPAEIQANLAKMGLLSEVISENKEDVVRVQVPVNRSDILHACDIMEDVAVAYGINNIQRSIPSTNTVGKPFPLNKLSDWIRREMAMCGWTEVLPLTLCSHNENYAFIRRKDPGNEAVVLANPQSLEYEVVRTTLLPGLLKTLGSNKKAPLPIQIFEIGDIVVQDPREDRRTRNERHLGMLYSSKTSGFEIIHGLLGHMMDMLMVPLGKQNAGKTENWYSIRPCEIDTFFPGRQAEILLNGTSVIGHFGILHPEVLGKFDLIYPCSYLEMNVEPFL